MAILKSYQNLILLQNLYRLKAIGFEYIDHFNINEKTSYETPASIEELSSNISSCHLCDLSKSRTQSMAGFGKHNADLFIIDFSISQIQDSTNDYYSGRSGETLKNMIEKVVGLKTQEVFISHCIKCKPLGSNKPSPSEYNSCKSYLYSQLEFIKPKVLMVLGEDAYTHLTGDNGNFEDVRGHVIDFKGTKLIPIYHPNYLLRNPESKKITLNDLNTIKNCLSLNSI